MTTTTRGSTLFGRSAARRLCVRFFVAPFIIGVLATPAAAAAGDDHQLKLKAAIFDPAAGLPADLVEKAPPAVVLAAPAGRGELYIVQFHETPAAAEQARLAGLGIRVLDYLPERALIVRLPAGTKPGTLPSLQGVRAVVPFAPKLRMSPDLRDLASAKPPAAGGEAVRINAWLAVDGDPEALAKEAQKSFPGVTAASIRREPVPLVQFSGPPGRLQALAAVLARHPDVLFVDPARPNRLLNDQSIWIGQSYNRVDGPGEAAAADPKPYTLSGTVFNRGITGTGQVIGVVDTRLEHQQCYFTDPAHPLVKQSVPPPGALTVDPNNRKILAYNLVSSSDIPPYPAWRHGTHTAGSAVADSLVNLSTPSSAGHDAGDGTAPNAKLVYLDFNWGVNTYICTDIICQYCPLADMLTQEYNAGARVSTHSYESDEDGAADATVWLKPDLLVFFAAGNAGTGGMWAANGSKNVVSVGATESYDATFNHDAYGIRDPDNMASFSSVGLVPGRIKPDVTVPGVSISSAGFPVTYYSASNPLFSEKCVQGDPNVCFPTYPPIAGGCYVSDASQTCTTIKLSGTSMASPTAAGLGALARQYFTDGFYPTGQATPADARNPSAALLKGVLINGARNMTGRILGENGDNAPRTDFGPLADAPSNRQGWGRIMLDDALYFAGDSRKLFLADIPSVTGSGLGTGDRLIYKVDVTSTASPLKFTLVWTDPPDSPPSGLLVRNDLDLVVTAPNGTVYKGNQWTADNINVPGDMESAANPAGRDSTNNVEGVLIHSPQVGEYRFEIQGANVPGYQTLFTQGFSLVVTGEFTGGFAFAPPPRILSVSPGFGINNDPTPISITGTGFQAMAQVYLGTATEPQKYALSAVMFVSSTQMQATVPVDMVSGSYNMTVINPDGLSGALANVFIVGAPMQNTTLYIAGSNPDVSAADNLTVIDLAQSVLLPPVVLTPSDDPVDVAVNRIARKGVIAMSGGQSGRVGILNLNLGKVTTTISVPNFGQGYRPWAVAIHPSGNPAYVLTRKVTPGTSQQLSRLDLSTGSFIGTPLTLGVWDNVSLTDLEVSPDGQRVYATNSGADTLSVIRTSDFVEILPRVPVGDGPGGIGVSLDSSRVYVTNFLSDTISIVDAASLTSVGTIDVSYQPNPSYTTRPKDVIVSPDGAKLYVAFHNGWGVLLWNVATVDLTTGMITQTLTSGYQYQAVAYVPSLARLYALAFVPDLKRLNPATLQVEWTQSHGLYSEGMDWVEPPLLTITSVVPNTACMVGGNTVTITGTGFQGEVQDGSTIVQQRTRVFFGTVEATSVTLIDSMHLSVVAPAQAAGEVDVEVRNPNGLSATVTSGFTYPPQEDPDSDGRLDACDNCPQVYNPGQEDVGDSDSVGDLCDNCPTVPNLDQGNEDTDPQGDACDNCDLVANPGQENADGDTWGNACDNCWSVTNQNQANSDGDAWGNVCDTCPNLYETILSLDTEHDGYGSNCDNCPLVYNPTQADGDGDGVGDACDNCPYTYNPTQAIVPWSLVVYPNGGEHLVINDLVTLRWNACAQTVDILLSRNGVNGDYSTLFQDAANTGTRNWTVTGPKTTGATAFLKVVAKAPGVPSVADTSNSGFTIQKLIGTGCSGCQASYCSGEHVRCNQTGECGPGGCCNYSCVTDMTCTGPDPCPPNVCGGC